MTPKELLEKIFTEPHANPAWFQDAFLRAVPIQQIDVITQQVIASSGKLKEVRSTEKEHVYDVVFEKATNIATIILVDGKIQTLFIKPGETRVASLDEALRAFAALPGKVAYVVLANDKPIAQLRETEPSP